MQTLGGQRAFTLIELLVAIAVVGVLAGLAYPAYVSHVQRGKIAAALGELTAVRVRLEQYYQDNRNYGSTAGGCAVAMPSATGFGFTCSWGAGATSQSFVVTATGQPSQGMSGFVYTLNETDQQRTVQFGGATVNAACWIRKKGETC